MAQYEVNQNSVQTLLAWIHSGEVAIPEIQRPFVWDAIKVRDLIDSLYAGFPVGYIIVWRNPSVRLKDGTTSLGKKILIDGQQRVTALCAAIVGQEVLGQNYKKKRITIAFNPLEERFEVANPAIRKDSEWISDIAPIYQPDFDTFNFVIQYASDNQLDSAQRSRLNDVINKLKSMVLNNIGVIELSHELDITQVTDIFIRINSKGVVLSQADFVMSKIASDKNFGGTEIRKTIDYFCHFMERPADLEKIKVNDPEFSSTEAFKKITWASQTRDPIYIPAYTDVLRVAFTYKFVRSKLADLVSLLSGRNFATHDFEEAIAEQSFNQLHDGVLAFINQTNFKRFQMILNSIGIVSKSLIRSQNVLNFSYALYLLLKEREIAPEVIEQIVRRWTLLTLLTGRYSGSPESTFEYDIKRFASLDPMQYLQSIEAGELSNGFWDNVLIRKLETPVSSSPYYHVYLMAQIKMHDLGFLSSNISVQSLVEQRGDIHHIFPKKYLQNNGFNDRVDYNQIANYAYTQSEINIHIGCKAPCEYMSEVIAQCGDDSNKHQALRDNLTANCIPESLSTMDYMNFKEFLEQRRILMAQKIHDFYKMIA